MTDECEKADWHVAVRSALLPSTSRKSPKGLATSCGLCESDTLSRPRDRTLRN